MKVLIVESIYVVGSTNEPFSLALAYKHYELGVKIHRYGLRIMLIWWHILIKF